MKKNSNKLYTIIGGLIFFSIIVVINVIISVVGGRVDLTENSIYTLSEGSKKILKKLDTPVRIKFYYSKSNPKMPVVYKSYAKRVEDLLEEYEEAGDGNIVVEKYDPEPFSDAEDAAMMDGVNGQSVDMMGGDKIYLGLSISCVEENVAIPFLSLDKENLLEYDITNAITQVFKTDKKTIGVMSAFKVLGGMDQPMNPMMMQMGQMPASKPAWIVMEQLKQNYELKEIAIDAKEIDKEIDTLIVLHPSGISDVTQFAIDQFVLRGGKLLAFIDPSSYSAMSKMQQNRQAMQQLMGKMSSNLDKLLPAWGIDLTEKIAYDRQYGHQQTKAVLQLTKNAFSKDDIVMSQLNNMLLLMSGSLKGEPTEGLKKESLIKTSKKASFVSAMGMNRNLSVENFSEEGKEYDLAIKLTGTFKTAFPDGKPKDKDDASDNSEKSADSADDSLKKSVKPGFVILVADSDLLVDDFCVRVQNFFGQKMVSTINDNLSFFQSMVDLSTGDDDLVSIRCRQSARRPLEKVKELEAEAKEKMQRKIIEAQTKINDVIVKINQLQSKKSGDKSQQLIMSPEQEKELARLQESQVNLRKELKHYQKELRKDINALETNFKIFNIAMMPFFFIVLGLGVAIYRKKRSAAQ